MNNLPALPDGFVLAPQGGGSLPPLPPGFTHENQPLPSMAWGDVGMQAIQNAPASALKFAKDIVQPVLHPIDTAKGLYNVGAGALDMANAATNAAIEPYVPSAMGSGLPEASFSDRYKHALTQQSGHEGSTEAVGQYFGDRYGSLEGFKKSLASDPIGVVGDVSAALTGGGGLAERAPSVIGKVGEIARAAGDVLNPVGAAVKVGQGAAAIAKANPFAKAFEASRDPDRPAARAIQSAFDKDAGKGLSDQELKNAAYNQQPIRMMDVGGGRATTRLARTASNFSPEAQETLDRTIGLRADTRHERTADFISGLQNYPDAHAQQRAIKDAGKAANRIFYDRAMAKGAAGVWNDRLGELINHPWVRKAIPAALEESNAEAVLDGRPAMHDPFDVDAAGNLTLRRDASGNAIRPTLEFWDALKKHIDDRVSGASPTPTSRGEPNTVRIGGNIRDALLKETDRLIPEYKTARAVAQRFFGASDALQAGRDLATPGTRAAKLDNRVLSEQLKKYTPAERHLLQDGLIDQLGVVLRGPKGRTVLDDLKSSSNARNRLLMILGPNKLAGITAYVHVEDVMDRFRTAVRGNSTSLQQAGDMARISVSPSHLLHLKTAMIGFIEHAAKKIGVGLDERVAKSIAEMLTDEDPDRYNRALSSIQKNKTLAKIFSVLPSSTQLNAASRAAAGLSARQDPNTQRPN